MIYDLSIDVLSENQLSSQDLVSITIPYYKYKIELWSRSGAILKTWYLGADNCTIKGYEYSLADSGCGDASLDLATIDFPILQLDIVKIYRRVGNAYELKYRGYISKLPDAKKGRVTISSYWDKFQNALYSGTFSGVTLNSKWQTIIEAKQEQTGVYWNASTVEFVDTGSKDYTHDYEALKKIFEDDRKLISDIYIGMDQNGFFFAKYRETVLSHIVYDTDYVLLDRKVDTKQVKYTRAQVMQKSGSTTTRLGEVGYGGLYPVLTALENSCDLKEGKITIPADMAAADGLDYGYNQIINQRSTENIKIKGLHWDKKHVRIGQLIRVWDKEELIVKKIIPCDSLIDANGEWTGATLSTDYVEGTGSVTTSSAMYYSFKNKKKWIKYKKFGFYIKSDVDGAVVEFSIGTNADGYGAGDYGDAGSDGGYGANDTDLFSPTNRQTVFIKTIGAWQFVEFETNIDDWQYIGFKSVNGQNIYVDYIYKYGFDKEVYTGTVIKISDVGDKSNDILVDVEIGDWSIGLTDTQKDIDSRLKNVELAITV